MGIYWNGFFTLKMLLNSLPISMTSGDLDPGKVSIHQSTESGAVKYFFDDFELDIDRAALIRDGSDIPLRPKSFEVLHFLVAHQGVLTTREQLFDAVWPDVVVTPDSINQCIAEIRRAIGDEERTMIRTVHGRGFVFETPATKQRAGGGVKSERSSRTRKGLASPRHRNRMTTVLALFALTIAVVFLASQHVGTLVPQDVGSNRTVGTGRHSIVVLPFTDLSPEGDQEYLADGIAEELLTLLSQVQGLRVISRTSAFAFKGKQATVPEIAQLLRATHVLEGSVSVEGETLRVTAQLIDSEKDEHIWAQAFDRTLDSVFAIQREIATLVVRQLASDLVDDLPRIQQTSPEAYALFLKSDYDVPTEESVDGSIEKLERIVAIDPLFAPAWAKLARRYFYKSLNFDNSEDLRRSASEAAQRAVQLDPYDANAYIVLGQLDAYYNQFQKAAEHYERAFELDPANEALILRASFLLESLGRLDEAADLLLFAVDRNPLDYSPVTALALTLTMAKRTEEAETYWRRALELNPSAWDWVFTYYAVTLMANGKPDEAQEVIHSMPAGLYKIMAQTWYFQQIGDLDRYRAGFDKLVAAESKMPAIDAIRMYAAFGQADEVFARLESIEQFRHWARERFWPMYWFIEDDPRWPLFLAKAGVIDAQLEDVKFNYTLPQW